MREIPLTRGLVALVDDEDYERVSEFKWRACVRARATYAIRTKMTNRRTKFIFMHRFIVGAPADAVIDHRDWNGLNNQRSNLRICTVQQNCANGRRKPGKSGFRGVQPISSGRWRAVISISGRLKHLGVFSLPEEAARIYDAAALNSFGEFAVLNFPREVIAK